MAQDSSKPDFWDTRYRGGVTPWDARGVPPQLGAWLAEHGRPQRVLVPGCGHAYEVTAFAQRGHDVLAIDFSDAALDAARLALGPLVDRVRKADFFHFEFVPFDLVYERAFLCALPRATWPAWGARVRSLVRAGGTLAGFFFFDDNAKGPPFGIAREALHALLEPAFVLEQDIAIPAEQSIAIFRDKERWQLWRRRAEDQPL
jgi:SAM-dependent methyltransferase